MPNLTRAQATWMAPGSQSPEDKGPGRPSLRSQSPEGKGLGLPSLHVPLRMTGSLTPLSSLRTFDGIGEPQPGRAQLFIVTPPVVAA